MAQRTIEDFQTVQEHLVAVLSNPACDFEQVKGVRAGKTAKTRKVTFVHDGKKFTATIT